MKDAFHRVSTGLLWANLALATVAVGRQHTTLSDAYKHPETASAGDRQAKVVNDGMLKLAETSGPLSMLPLRIRKRDQYSRHRVT